MNGAETRHRSRNRVATFASGTALALILTVGMPAPMSASAQSVDALGDAAKVAPDAQMLLEADELVYDNDAQTVAAVGGVRIDYGGNQLVARKVTYNQRTGRMFAEGNVEIIQPDGTRIYADKIDITDNFKDGFINALRIETTDNTRFAAESAERVGGEVTTFNQGVYTACEPCKDNPEKPPFWQIKSRKIIWDGKKKTVRFENARFELFGLPLAFLPVFEMADPTVKRKTGFLFPSATYKSTLGFGVRVPFYFALSPSYDLTVTGTGYTKQGFLTEAEWRQKFNSGSYNIKVAGIHQLGPEVFGADTVSGSVENRWMAGTAGKFEINPRWNFGWKLLAQSDKNFSYTYAIEGFSDHYQRNEIYLTGLSGRNYFDLHAYKHSVQATYASVASEQDAREPYVLPSLDYSWTAPNPVLGGELNFDLNAQGFARFARDYVAGPDSLAGMQGTSGRVTGELEWKRTFVTPGGLAVTPLLALRGDGHFVDPQGQSALLDAALIGQSEAFRTMATAGLELRWPILFSTTSATHILEPMAQIFVRNNERLIGQLPNEDAQSFVFDATNLFQRDKFSGFDRMEGGTRANLGLRYSGSFANGWGVHALFGQSFHLGGINSFASTSDLVKAGMASGLETKASDYVAMLGVTNSNGFAFSARGRFDERTFDIRRGELEASYFGQRLSLTGRYAYIAAQRLTNATPGYGFFEDRHEVGLTASAKFAPNWRAFGSATYDITHKLLAEDSIGLAYDNECFTFSLTGTETRSAANPGAKPVRSLGFFISLRTLGDIGTSKSLDGT